MRAVWSGTLSFGLVTIPVKLFSATEDKSLSFTQLRESDHSRIGYQRVAKADDEVVSYDDIVKGYEWEKGSYVVFDPEELSALKPRSSKEVQIEQFVPLDQIDPVYFQRTYLVIPEASGLKAYGLLSEAMADRGSVAVCTITLRDKQHLACLRLRDDHFVLETMHWPDEVKAVSLEDFDLPEVPEARPQEVKMASQLIDSLTEDFDPEAFHDTYREQVLAAVEAKVEGQEISLATEEGETGEVIDLMAALEQSVQRAKERAGGGATDPIDDPDQSEPIAEAAAAAPKKRTAKKAAKKATKKSAKKSAKKAAKKAAKKSAKKAAKKGAKKAAKKSAKRPAAKKQARKAS